MKKIFIPFVTLVALVSCVQESVEEPLKVREVSIFANASETKTLLNSDDEVVWENGDAMALCFTSASDVSTVEFTASSVAVNSNVAEFKGSLPVSVSVDQGYDETGHAVYPSTAVGADGTVSFTLPAEMKVGNSSFDSKMNLSSANVSLQSLNENGTADATFKNAFSIIRFKLSSGVTSLKITADGNIAGSARMDFDQDGRLSVSQWNSPSRTLTITPKSGVTFTADQTYNVLVYPGTYNSLSVHLTDINDCVYEKTIQREFVFDPSNFYTFNFNTKFEKSYSFIGTGRNFKSTDKIMTVYYGEVGHEEELQAEMVSAGARFSGNLPADLVAAGSSALGFAVYPSTAYDMASDKITYNLPSTVDSSTEIPELYSAHLYVGIEEAKFNSVAQSLSKLTFDLPAGISRVTVRSTTGIVGTATMTVSYEGVLVPGSGSSNTLIINPEGVAGTYTAYVYPLDGADLTVTYTDMAGGTVEETVKPESGSGSDGGDYEVPVPELKFDKNGSFTNDSFTDGGSYDF